MSETREIEWVTQVKLADALGVTDRRVRQMVEQFLLPQAHCHTGLWDLKLCRDRYKLYRDGSTRDWDDFYDELLDFSKTVGPLCDAAMDDEATLDDVRRASIAVQDIWARMKFCTAAKAKSDAEREFHLLIWKQKEDEQLGGICHRGLEIMGATHLDLGNGEVLEINPAFAQSRARRMAKKRAQKAEVAGPAEPRANARPAKKRTKAGRRR